MLTLQDLKTGDYYENIKTKGIYRMTGYIFDAETLDLKVKYKSSENIEWARPIGLFMLKFDKVENKTR